MDIDLIYLWVNGSDPAWAAKRDRCVGKPAEGSSTHCAGRYTDNGELRYSLRSVEKYAPWIRRIFIVTDHQVPDWLDTDNPRVRIVDHSEILPEEARPCFNSVVLEHFFHRIPGLAEHFLYANDDMMLHRPVEPATFFAPDGLPITRLKPRLFWKQRVWVKTRLRGKSLSNYQLTIHRTALLVESQLGHYYGGITHHNIDAYRLSDYRHARELFDFAIRPTLAHHVRSDNDIQRCLYTFVARAEGRAHIRFVTKKTSFRLLIERPQLYEKFRHYNPTFFCVEDSEHASDDDRLRARAFMQQLFPEKSQFER